MTAVQSVSDAKNGNQIIATAFYGVGGDMSLIQHIHLQWDAVFVGVFTFESSDFPELDPTVAGAAGAWVQENPSTAYVAISPAGSATVVNATVTVPGGGAGGAAGGASINIGNLGSYRLRVKVVCTTAGVIRIRAHGKY